MQFAEPIFLDAEEVEKSIYFEHHNFLKYLKDLVLQTLKYEKSLFRAIRLDGA